MPFELVRADGFVVSDDRERLDLDRICGWLPTAYWAATRDRATIERSVANSYPYGLYDSAGDQVGFTRVTSDLASFAWIGDVIIDESLRGRGLGTGLVGTAVEHMKSRGVPRLLLSTRDAYGVYARLGFESLRVPAIWMELDTRPHRPRPGEPIGRPSRAAPPAGADRMDRSDPGHPA